MGMWAGVTVSVLSVQLRFQAQTQLRQTFDDSAQKYPKRKSRWIKIQKSFNKILFYERFCFSFGSFFRVQAYQTETKFAAQKNSDCTCIHSELKKKYDWYKSTKFVWKFTLLVPNKIKLSGNFFCGAQKNFDVGDVQ
jgi:hypothetical protein